MVEWESHHKKHQSRNQDTIISTVFSCARNILSRGELFWVPYEMGSAHKGLNNVRKTTHWSKQHAFLALSHWVPNLVDISWFFLTCRFQISEKRKGNLGFFFFGVVGSVSLCLIADFCLIHCFIGGSFFGCSFGCLFQEYGMLDDRLGQVFGDRLGPFPHIW